jgi:hypothetical protein
MSLRTLAALQWVGLLAGALVWASQFVIGFGVTQAVCGAGGSRWGIENDTWQAALMGTSALLVAAAGAAAVLVVLRTSDASYDQDGPPVGRIRFFAIAAVAANADFLMIVLLSGFGSIFNVACRQA